MDTDALRAQVQSWLSILDDSTYYELLSLLEIADQGAVQAAFHEFSVSFHPDRHRGQPEDIRSGVTTIYRRGAEAYGVLRDETSRAAYDLAMAQGHLRLPSVTGLAANAKEAQSLTTLCQTAGGRLHAKQAERALSEKQIQEAERLFGKALLAEGHNPELEDGMKRLLQIARDQAHID